MNQVRTKDDCDRHLQKWVCGVITALACVLVMLLSLPFTYAYASDTGAGNIEVTKKVVSDFDSDKNVSYHFEVTLDDTSINGTYGDESQGKPMTFVNGVASFDLADTEVASTAKTKAGATVYTLPAGVGYTVTEETPDGMTTTWNGSTGTIAQDATATVEATNTRETGGFTVTLLVESGDPADLNKTFMMPMVIDQLNGEYLIGTFGDVTFGDRGTAVVTLKHGQSVTVTGVPAGIRFTASDIYTADFDYVCDVDPTLGANVNKNSVTAHIIPNATPSITFTNSNKNYGPLTVGKKVVSDIVDEQEFHFTVTLTNGDNTPADVSGELSAVDVAPDGTQQEADKVSFTNGVARIVVKGGYEKSIKGLPSSLSYIYKVEEDEANNGIWVTTAEGETGTVSHDGEKAVFTNERTTGDLDVTATVVDEDSDDAKGKLWSFTVTLYADEAAARAGKALNITKSCGDMEFKGGVATFSLATGQTIHAVGIPSGVYYVVEGTAEDGWTTTKISDTGFITSDEVASAEFVNRSTEGTGEVRVLKALEGREWTADDEFVFELTADSAVDADGNEISPDKMPMPSGETTITIGSDSEQDEDGNRCESFGAIEFTEPGTYTYQVNESETDGIWCQGSHTVVFTATAEEDSGQIHVAAYSEDYYGQPEGEVEGTNVTANVRVMNRYLDGPGRLVVRKVVKNATDKQKAAKFGFEVTIKNKDGKADESVFGGYGATYTNADGTTKSEVITFSKGVAKFKLKDGQSVEIASLPLDTAYEVKETYSGGLVASWVGATGKISASQKATATCTNSRKTDQTQPTKTSGTSSRSLPKTGDETDPVAPMVAAAAAGMLIGAGFFMRHRRENA